MIKYCQCPSAFSVSNEPGFVMIKNPFIARKMRFCKPRVTDNWKLWIVQLKCQWLYKKSMRSDVTDVYIYTINTRICTTKMFSINTRCWHWMNITIKHKYCWFVISVWRYFVHQTTCLIYFTRYTSWHIMWSSLFARIYFTFYSDSVAILESW